MMSRMCFEMRHGGAAQSNCEREDILEIISYVLPLLHDKVQLEMSMFIANSM